MTVEEKFCRISSGSLPWNCIEWECIANKLTGHEKKVAQVQFPYEGVKP